MKMFPVILACIAVIIASAQAYWTWRTRNHHVEALVAGRQLDACAEIGAAATEFAFRSEAAQANFSELTFEAVSESPRALAKASYMAAYLLPQEASVDSAQMRELSQRIVAALAQREEGRVADLMREFDAANLRVQTACRLVIQRSLFAPRGLEMPRGLLEWLG
jgi:hypothetical protein